MSGLPKVPQSRSMTRTSVAPKDSPELMGPATSHVEIFEPSTQIDMCKSVVQLADGKVSSRRQKDMEDFLVNIELPLERQVTE